MSWPIEESYDLNLDALLYTINVGARYLIGVRLRWFIDEGRNSVNGNIARLCNRFFSSPPSILRPWYSDCCNNSWGFISPSALSNSITAFTGCALSGYNNNDAYTNTKNNNKPRPIVNYRRLIGSVFHLILNIANTHSLLGFSLLALWFKSDVSESLFLAMVSIGMAFLTYGKIGNFLL